MSKVLLTADAKRLDSMSKRMDRFDSVVVEYLRSSGKTVQELSTVLGVDTSTLWRYRHRVQSFENAPFGVITNALKVAHCSSECLRFICGW